MEKMKLMIIKKLVNLFQHYMETPAFWRMMTLNNFVIVFQTDLRTMIGLWPSPLLGEWRL